MPLNDDLPEDVRKRIEMAKERVCVAIDDLKVVKKDLCRILDGEEPQPEA